MTEVCSQSVCAPFDFKGGRSVHRLNASSSVTGIKNLGFTFLVLS